MKPLTAKMIEVLMDCHEKELLKHEPCTSYDTLFAKGLITRGLVDTYMHTSKTTGKKHLAFRVTVAGKEYLNNYSNKK